MMCTAQIKAAKHPKISTRDPKPKEQEAGSVNWPSKSLQELSPENDVELLR